MLEAVICGVGRVDRHHLPLDDEQLDQPFRSAVKCATDRALNTSPYVSAIPMQSGVALLTSTGERWPSQWVSLRNEGKRVRPHMYTSTVHNAAIGRITNVLDIQGPQYSMLYGDVLAVSRLQVECSRAPVMLTCAYEYTCDAACLVVTSLIEAEKEGWPYVPVRELVSSYDPIRTVNDFLVLCEDPRLRRFPRENE